MRASVLVSGVVLCLASTTLAQAPPMIRWAEPVSGRWEDPHRWDLGRVPGPSDHVLIAGDGPAFTVTLETSQEIAAMTVTGASAALKMGDSSTGSADFRVTVRDSALVDGQVTLVSCEQRASAGTTTQLSVSNDSLSITKAGVLSLLGCTPTSPPVVVTASVRNEGQLQVKHATSLQGPRFTNVSGAAVSGGALLSFDGESSTNVNEGLWALEVGGIRLQRGNELTLRGGTVTGTAPLVADGGTVVVDGATVETAIVAQQSGVLRMQRGEVGEPVQIRNGGRLVFDAGFADAGSFHLAGIDPVLEGGVVPTKVKIVIEAVAGGTRAFFAQPTSVRGAVSLTGAPGTVGDVGLQINTGSLVVEAGGVVQVEPGGSGVRAVIGRVESVGLLQAAAGTELRFEGPVHNRFDGVASGVLAGDGGLLFGDVFVNEGIVSPGSDGPGLLTLDGAVTLPRLDVDVGDPAAGEQHDRLRVTRTATLSGALHIRLVKGFIPTAGQEFAIVRATDGVQGAFTSVVGELEGGATGFEVITTEQDVVLRATHQPSFSLQAPASVVAGAPFAVGARALNGLRAVDGTYANVAELSASDPGAVIAPTTQRATAGLATWTGVELRTAGVQTVVVKDVATPTQRAELRVAVEPAALSATSSLVTAASTSLEANGVATTVVTVVPRDAFGNRRGPGAVVTMTTTAGALLGTVRDAGDGTYTQTLQVGTQPGTAVVRAAVAGVPLQTEANIALTADVTPPDAVVLASEAVVGQAVRVSWTAAAAPDLARYVVVATTSTGAEVEQRIIAAPTTAADFVTLPSCAALDFTVRPVDRAGNLGQRSNVVAVTTQRDGAPEAPSGLDAVAGDTIVTLTIGASPSCDVVEHRIKRSLTQGTGYVTVASLPAGALRVVDDGVTNGVRTFYVAVGVDGDGNEGAPSDEVEVVPGQAPPAEAVLGFVATSRPAGVVALSWSPPVDAPTGTAYRVYRQATPFSQPGLAALLTTTTALGFEDAPPSDGAWFYAVTWLDERGRESKPALGSAVADRVAPRGVLSLGRSSPVGIGEHPLTLTLSEPLAAPPQLTLHVPPAAPRPVTLVVDPADPTVYVGEFAVVEDGVEGPARFDLAARDAAGNENISLTGDKLDVDGARPTITLATTAKSPVTTKGVELTLASSEPLATTPALAFVSATDVRWPVDLTGSGLRFDGVLSVGPDTGDGPGSFVVRAEDRAGNAAVGLAGLGSLVIDFNVGPVVRLEATPSSTSLLVDEPLDLVLVARDALDRIDDSYRGTVRLTATDPTATLADDVRFGPDSGGRAPVSAAAVFRQPGEWLLLVTDLDVPSLQATLTIKVTSTCGDGRRTSDERCDDGNVSDGDGCTGACTFEEGFACGGEVTTSCEPVCGDGLLVAGERCDDGGVGDGDGCTAACRIEVGFACTGAPSVCVAGCGDSVVIEPEACDDGAAVDGDGCSAACAVEPGFTCEGSPSVCRAPGCGDGVLDCDGGERCDDGNRDDGDGCTAACLREQPSTVRWLAQAGEAPSACGGWASGAPPQDGDAVIVDGAATADLPLPAVSLASLVVEPGYPGTVTLATNASGAQAFVASIDVASGTLATAPSGFTVVGGVVVRGTARLRVSPGDAAALVADGGSGAGSGAGAALVVRADLVLQDDGVLDAADGVLVLAPAATTFVRFGVTAAAPVTVGDLVFAPSGIEDEQPTVDLTIVVDAPLTVARQTLVRSQPASATTTLIAGPSGALRTRDLRTLGGGDTPGSIVVQDLPLAFTGALVLDDPAVAWRAPIEFAGSRGAARVSVDGVRVVARAGLLTLDADAGARLAGLSARGGSVVVRGGLSADVVDASDDGQLLVQGDADVGALTIAGGRFVAPAQTAVRRALVVDDPRGFVAGRGRVTLGVPAPTSGLFQIQLDEPCAVSGTANFHDLTLTGDAVEFAPAAALTVAGTWTARGTPERPLSLRSAVPGEPWGITPRGPVDLDHLVVRDSHNRGAVALDPPSWTDAGGNVGWGAVDGCAGLVASDGDVVLADDAAVAAFAASGVQCVRGDLVLTGSVTAVSLPGVVRILGALRIEGTTDLGAVALPGLEDAAAVIVTDNGGLQSLELGGLQVTGDLTLAGNGALTTVDLGALVDIDGDLTVTDNDALATLELGALHNVGGDLLIDDHDALASLELSALATVGGDLTLSGNDALASVELGVTEIGGSLSVVDNDALVELAVAFLRAVLGDLFVGDNDALAALVLAALQQVGGDAAITGGSDVDVFVVQLSSLQDVGGGTLEVGAADGGQLALDVGALDTESTSLEVEGELTGGSLVPPGACDAGCDVCGDGVRGASEQCDDDNAADGDGCSAACVVEVGFTCAARASGDAEDACVPDGDGDGVADAADVCPTVADPAQQDEDGDRRGDACDVDDDDDGVKDALDNCPSRANAEQRDRDGDGTGDACDDPPPPATCGGDAVADDADGDGTGDGCDDDVDGDGVVDTVDVCVGAADAAQGDADGDGTGDACDDDDDGDGVADGDDPCPLVAGATGCQGDLDGDGVFDDDDACPVGADAAQADADGDGLGDACDADQDGDGVPRGADVCPTVADAEQQDSDGDGIGDACDECRDEPGDLPGRPCADEPAGVPPDAVVPETESCASGAMPSPLSLLLALLGVCAGSRRRGRAAGARAARAARPAASVGATPGAGALGTAATVAATVVATFGLVADAAHAQATAPTRWAPVAGDAFADPANWTGGAVPGAGDDVVIDAASPPCAVAGVVRVRSVQLDGVLRGDGGARVVTTASFVAGANAQVEGGMAVQADGGVVVVDNAARVPSVAATGPDVTLTLAGAVDVVDVAAGAVVVFDECRGAGAVNVDAAAVVVVDGPCAPSSWTQRGGQSLWRAGSAGADAFVLGALDAAAGVIVVEGELRVTGALLRVAPPATLALDAAALVLDSAAVTVDVAAPLSAAAVVVAQAGADVGVALGGGFAVSGGFTAVGRPASPIVLRGAAPSSCPPAGCASTWSLRAQGLLDLRYVVLRDAANGGPVRALSPETVDGGNNVGWQAPPAACGGRPAVLGPVVLADAAAVAAFDSSGITCIDGDLQIAGAVNVVTLRFLEVVTGRILVARVAATVVSFDALTAAGDVAVQGNTALQGMELGALQDVGGSLIVDHNDALGVLELSGLQTVGGDLVFTDNDGYAALSLPPAGYGGAVTIGDNEELTTVSLGVGSDVGGDVTVTGNVALATLQLGMGGAGGDLLVAQNPSLGALDLGGVQQTGGSLTITGNDALTTIEAGDLQSVGGSLDLGGNDALAQADLGGLVQVLGNFTVVDNPALVTLVLTTLALIGADFVFVDNTAMITLDLSALQGIGGDFVVTGNDSLTSIEAGSLESVGGSLQVEGNGSLATIDLAALDSVGGELDIGENAPGADVGLGDLDSVGGTLSVQGDVTLPPGQACDAQGRCGAVCGDGIVVADVEACDDGNQQDGDGCSAVCAQARGFLCVTPGAACLPDADDDGVADAFDVCPRAPDFDQRDTDGDGAGDACDRDDDDDGVADVFDGCPRVADAAQRDEDGDGTGDACDPDFRGEAPAGDADGDGVGDDADVCPAAADAAQGDADGDGAGDACDDDDDGDGVADGDDPCRLVPGADCAGDADGDGISDEDDACALLAGDGEGGDADEDGLGDACDADDDGDVVTDTLDNCRLTFNPSQADRDDDGVGDACDRCFDVDDIAAGERCVVDDIGCAAGGVPWAWALGALVLAAGERRRRASA